MSRYGYFWGCYVQGRLPYLERSTRLVMQALGIDAIDMDGLSCCPEKSMMKGTHHRAWLLTAARNLCLAEKAGVTLATPCPGCLGTLKGAKAELAGLPENQEAVNRGLERIGRRYRGKGDVVHLLDVLYKDIGPAALQERIKYSLAGLRIAVHYGCHLLQPSSDLQFDDPFRPKKFEELLEGLGATSVEYETKMQCCGNLLLRAGEEDASHAMARSKLMDLERQEVDAITLVCPSCMMQFDNTQFLLQRRGERFSLPTIYFFELVGLALGFEPEELGISDHRVDATPFLNKWRSLQRRLDAVREHWDHALVANCAECGACNQDCPVSKNDPGFDPNALVRQLAEGELEAVLSSSRLWKCIECYTCSELCWQRYGMVEIFRRAKQLAIERGMVPKAIAEGIGDFHSRGRLVEGSTAKRRRMGLPAIPSAPVEELNRLLAEREKAEE